MVLRIAMLAYTPSLRLEVHAEGLVSRGDDVVVLGAGLSVLRATARLAADHLRRPFDVVIIEAPAARSALAALVPRAGGAAIALDLLGSADPYLAAAPLVGEALVAAVIARDGRDYRAFNEAGIGAHRLFLIRDAPLAARFPATKDEPAIGKGGPLVVAIHGALGVAEACFLLAGLERAQAAGLRIQIEMGGSGDGVEWFLGRGLGDSVGVGSDLSRAHAALVLDRELEPRLAEVWSVGLPAIAPRGIAAEAEEAIEPFTLGEPADLARAFERLAKDKELRKRRRAAASAWREEHGFDKQRSLFFRMIDHLAEEKVKAARRAKQAAVEGVKTGTRRT